MSVIKYLAITLLAASTLAMSPGSAWAQSAPQIVTPTTSSQSAGTQAETVRGATDPRLKEKSAKEQSGKTGEAKNKKK